MLDYGILKCHFRTYRLSRSRFHAVSLQPTDHAHNEQYATHLHIFPLHPESAAATAATSYWRSSGPTACVAASDVGAIRGPVGQR